MRTRDVNVRWQSLIVAAHALAAPSAVMAQGVATLYGQPMDSPSFAGYSTPMCLSAAIRAAEHSTASRADSIAAGGPADTVAMVRTARACTAYITTTAIGPRDQRAAVELALLEGDDSAAIDRVGRWLAGAPSAVARGHALQEAIGLFAGERFFPDRGIAPPVRPGMLAAARRYTAMLDSLPAADVADRLQARLALLHYEQMHDVGRAGLSAAPTIMRLVNAIPLGRAADLAGLVRDAYQTVVSAYLDADDTASARRILRVGAAERPDLRGNAGQWFAYLAAMDTLVGRPAPPIAATYWFDGSAGDTLRPLPKGRVTLIEFTDPIYQSLRTPTIRRLVGRYGDDSLGILAVTTLRGFFRWTVPIAPAAEVDSLKVRFGGEHLPHVTVAASTTTSSMLPDGRVVYAPSASERAYGATTRRYGFLAIVDRQGTIRAIEPRINPYSGASVPWGYNVEDRLTAILDHVLRGTP